MLWNNQDTSHARGIKTEAFAENYLTEHGLTLVGRNIHCRQGEIDLVMREDDTYVFIEVKYRKNNRYGSACETVSLAKQKKNKTLCRIFFPTSQVK